jgi:uncharacterized protein (TIGR00299 family) protein
MRIGYLDCFCGISGDMCLGALVDAGVPLDAIRDALAGLPLKGYELTAEKVIRHGLAATKVSVVVGHDHKAEHEHEHEQRGGHPHRGLSDVLAIIEAGGLPAKVAEDSARAFRLLAEAEAAVHNIDVDSIHFHEVGAVDAICDIVGTMAGLHHLGLDRLQHSPVSVGGGTVKCAHGLLPVPAPATAALLRGVPTAGGPVDRELTTPTGAAILRAVAEPVPTAPAMRVESIGYGAGGRELDGVPNVLRLLVGEAEACATEADTVWVLEANLDDMTGEELGHCLEKLMAGGALDAFVTPVQMKKNRPGALLTVLCEAARLAEAEALLWRHTSTLGIRRTPAQRSKLRREIRAVSTPWGDARVKVGFLGEKVVRREPEYEDCRRIADEQGLSLREVYRAVLRAADGHGGTSDRA